MLSKKVVAKNLLHSLHHHPHFENEKKPQSTIAFESILTPVFFVPPTNIFQYEGGVLEMFLTESQKNYYTAMKKLGRKKPQKVIRRPKNEIHAVFYDISLSRRFEIAIFALIFLNMVSMGIEHYNQSRVITFTLEICNALFTTIFALECCVKIIGLRFQYFTAGWNIFDFVLVIASIIGIVMEDMMDDFPVSPTLLRVVRVFRIGRILR